MRTAQIVRTTKETDIKLSLNLDGKGESNVDTGCGFLNHMLTLFAKHSGMDLDVSCMGDVEVDYHHTTEDIGICLGEALAEALGSKKGIVRYGYFLLPMDESLVMTAVDLSGRVYLGYDMEIPTEKIGDFDTELIEEFFYGFVRGAKATLHVKQMDGTNSHHIAEAAFKSVGRSLRQAVAIDERFANDMPSTKGVL